MHPIRVSLSANNVCRLPFKHDSLQMIEIKMRSKLENSTFSPLMMIPSSKKRKQTSHKYKHKSSWENVNLRMKEIASITSAMHFPKKKKKQMIDTSEAWRSLEKLSKFRPGKETPKYDVVFPGQLINESLRKLTDFVKGGYILDKEQEEEHVDIATANTTHRRFYSFAKLYNKARNEKKLTEGEQPPEGSLGEFIWKREYQHGGLRLPNYCDPKPVARPLKTTPTVRRRKKQKSCRKVVRQQKDYGWERTMREISRMRQAIPN